MSEWAENISVSGVYCNVPVHMMFGLYSSWDVPYLFLLHVPSLPLHPPPLSPSSPISSLIIFLRLPSLLISLHLHSLLFPSVPPTLPTQHLPTSSADPQNSTVLHLRNLFFAWWLRELISLPVFIQGVCARHVTWKGKVYKLQWGGTVQRSSRVVTL